jgi:hypothetical protein
MKEKIIRYYDSLLLQSGQANDFSKRVFQVSHLPMYDLVPLMHSSLKNLTTYLRNEYESKFPEGELSHAATHMLPFEGWHTEIQQV